MMKTKITWFDRIMAAVTFAEANEQDAGRKFLAGTGRKSQKEQQSKEYDAVLTADLPGAEVPS
jgi:hypothetical protein